MHVVDVDATAKALSPLLKMDELLLKTLLKKDVYQVELGPGGRDLSQIEMEVIKKLNLPGIDFTMSSKRYYPNGDFASYAIGYTVSRDDEDGNVWQSGQMGVEDYFDDTLSGTLGYVTYEKDRYGYKIANGREYKEDALNGEDVYLTIDNSIQLFVENSVKKMQADSEAEWGFMVVADAKTGAILAYATTPSFDPNKRNIVNYIDPLTGYSYEPGSTMKTFSYMCAIENGKYNGSDTYDSGVIKFTASDGSVTIVHDWNKIGWGKINYDYGFAMSSNVGAANLLETKVIDKKMLKKCYEKYGFGTITNFTVNREQYGNIKFNYDIDAASATFGQGITVTPIQMIQALTSISNNGKVLKPYIIDKIVDTNTGDISYESTTEVVDTVADASTVSKVRELLSSVVCNDSSKCTGSAYYQDGYSLMGKTGTAQIYNAKTGTYMIGDSDYIYSFAGLYPSDEPNVIIYSALKKPKDTTNYVSVAVKDVVVNISKYLNIAIDNNKNGTYKISNYVNKNVNDVINDLSKNNMKVFVLGSGSKVIKQYPNKNSKLYSSSVVGILTDNYDKKMPDLIGLSYKDVINILKLMNVKYEIIGRGYAVGQSVKTGDIVSDDVVVKIEMNKS